MIVAIDTNAILPGQVGGIESYTLGLIEALKLPASPASRLVLVTRPENHELFSQYADWRTDIALLERPRGNWSELLASDPAAGRRAMADFARRKTALLTRHAVDLVHFPGNTINPLELNLPVVLNLHDLQHRHFPEYFSAEEKTNREQWWTASAHRADALIAASQFIRTDLHIQLGVATTKIFVAPDPFQSAFCVSPSPERLAELPERLLLPQTFFIYPAAVWPHKNHQRLIRAFAAAAIPDCQLILTGGGQAESTLPSLIAELNLQLKVRLLGRVSTDDLIGLYHLATGMIFPSEHESWSIPVMEAMACGCPVACSNVTSLPEEIGDAGILFAPDDSIAMTEAMRRLAGDAEFRCQLSDRGRRRVSQFGSAPLLQTLTAAYRYASNNHIARKAA